MRKRCSLESAESSVNAGEGCRGAGREAGAEGFSGRLGRLAVRFSFASLVVLTETWVQLKLLVKLTKQRKGVVSNRNRFRRVRNAAFSVFSRGLAGGRILGETKRSWGLDDSNKPGVTAMSLLGQPVSIIFGAD